MKDIPVEQCRSCGEFLIHDPVMENLDCLIDSVDSGIELEVRGLQLKAEECCLKKLTF